MTSPVAATVSATGISAPNFAAIRAYLVAQVQAIFGVDAYLGNDSQDGQLLGIIAQAISDANAAAVSTYNAYSPQTAIGNGLSSNVKINGLKRLAGSFSTALLTITGVANTVITNGFAQDSNGNQWALPTSVTIPGSGSVTVLATCSTLGAVVAAPSTITGIATPTFGWQTVTNSSAATPGAPVETDAQLRVRQALSTALPSQSVFDGIIAAIAQVTGVTRVGAYENNTSSTDSNGAPANSIYFVVEGGPADSGVTVCTAIASKIPPGISTFKTGTGFSNTITDALGTSRVINYMTPTESQIGASITVHPMVGWSVSTETLIIAAVNAYLTALPIGQVVNVANVIAAALLAGTAYAGTFLVKSCQLNKNGGSFQSTDMAMAFNEAATISNSSVVTTV